MKKILGLMLISLLFGISFATVGGPSIIDNIIYDETSNSIRYTKTFYDGLGGSEIYKYSIEKKENERITKLDNFAFAEGRYMDELNKLETYFQTSGFKPFKEFHLTKIPVEIKLHLKYFNELTNNESFEISKVNPHPVIENPDGYMMSGYVFSFIWDNSVYINNELKSTIELSTCRLNPINYRGFANNETDTIIIIATSEKRDCVEGGYIGEEAHIIPGIEIDKALFLQENGEFSQNKQEFQIFTGGLWIQPDMTGDNKVEGMFTIEIQKTKNIFEKIGAYIKKVLEYFF